MRKYEKCLRNRERIKYAARQFEFRQKEDRIMDPLIIALLIVIVITILGGVGFFLTGDPGTLLLFSVGGIASIVIFAIITFQAFGNP